MFIKQDQWEQISDYLSSQIKEYCAKKKIDKFLFSNKLGISTRALERLYSKNNSNSVKVNNKLLSSLEFINKLSGALEVDPVDLFRELNKFVSAKNCVKI